MTQAELNVYVNQQRAQIDANLPLVSVDGSFLMVLNSDANRVAASRVYGNIINPTSRTVVVKGKQSHWLDFVYNKPSKLTSTALLEYPNICDTGKESEMQTHTVQLNRVTSTETHQFTAKQAQNAGMTVEQYRAMKLQSAILEMDAKLALEVSTHFVSSKRGTKSEFIGNTAPRGGAARTPFTSLPMFKSDGTINPTGEIILNQDLQALEVADIRYFGGATLMQYATLKNLSCCVGGYNPQQLDVFNAAMAYQDTGVARALANLGKPNAFIAYRLGAMMFMPRVRFATPEAAGNATNYTVSSPNTGLQYDVQELVATCGTDGQIEYRVQVSLNWALVGYGQMADFENLGIRRYVTDVFAYDIEQANTTVFDFAPIDLDAALVSKVEHITPENVAVASDYGIALLGNMTSSALTLLASVTEGEGYYIQSYAWKVKGVANAATTQYLNINLATTPLVTGDTVEVIGTFTNGTTTATRSAIYTVA